MDLSVHNASMSRPIEFDRSKALKRALELFWRKGYQASSLTDLLDAMGIGRSSFYAAFTDKRSLYIECLDLFAAQAEDLMRRARNGLEPLDALQSLFVRNFNGTPGSQRQWGCLLVNTVTEMAGVDEDLVTRASDHLAEMQRIFQAYLEEAGANPARAEELAAMLMLLHEGIRVSSRRRLPDAQLSLPIDASFQLIRSAIR